MSLRCGSCIVKRWRPLRLLVVGVIAGSPACGEAGSAGGPSGAAAGSAGSPIAMGGNGTAGTTSPAGTGGTASATAGTAGGGTESRGGGAGGTANESGSATTEAGQGGEAPQPVGTWTPACPGNFEPMPGVNTGFPTPTGDRSFSLNLPKDAQTPRPVWVPLTGSVESTNENLDARGGNRKLTEQGYIVIGPVRRCAGSVSGAGTADNGGACNMAGSGGWTWNPWNEGRVFGPAGDPWKTDAGPDAAFLQAVVKCVATKYSVDQRRIFVGGISSGATMTNRALTFDSE